MGGTGLVPFLAIALLAGGLMLLIADRLVRDRRFILGGLLIAYVLSPAAGFVFDAMRPDTGSDVITGPRLWLLRLGTLAAIATIGLGLVKIASLRQGRPMSGDWIWAGAIVFAGTELLTEFVAGDIHQGTVLFALALTVLWMGPQLEPQRVAAMIKWSAVAIVAGSLAIAMAGLPGAWNQYPQSLIGLPLRLEGLAIHPNALGPVALLAMMMERLAPSPRPLRMPILLASVTTLFLSQSKTAWVIAVVVAVILWAGRSVSDRRAAIIAVTVIASATGLSLSLVGEELPTEQFSSVRTLTGRTDLWLAGLELWRESPVFGSGPDAFIDLADETDQEWAGQAHNQVIQELGTSGVVGLASLILYAAVMIRAAAIHARRTGWMSLALVAFLLIRSMTETPIDELNLFHLAVFALLLAWERDAVVEARPQAASHVPHRRPALRTVR